MWSEYEVMIERSFKSFSSSSSVLRSFSVTSVPRSAFSIGDIWYSPLPFDTHSTPWSAGAPALRVRSLTSSATMKEE